eukprot:363107-Chlamydomonas_euryale.AAC.8
MSSGMSSLSKFCGRAFDVLDDDCGDAAPSGGPSAGVMLHPGGKAAAGGGANPVGSRSKLHAPHSHLLSARGTSKGGEGATTDAELPVSPSVDTWTGSSYNGVVYTRFCVSRNVPVLDRAASRPVLEAECRGGRVFGVWTHDPCVNVVLTMRTASLITRPAVQLLQGFAGRLAVRGAAFLWLAGQQSHRQT